MKIGIQSIHFNPDSKLINFINKKIEKVTSIDDSIIKIDVFLKIDRPESPINKIVEIRIHTSKGERFAKKQCDTFEESVDLTIQALRKQVLKHK
tara:strand:- start:190 stop:471 length:282 start_codon:yes stop_codon:yes gene_type:complete